ncbi:MAG: signal peptidase II [Candidatus Kapabacteria bacterium]|nr:signal peptidase II [Candidatus Kapabacteria bacterium]
MSNTKKSGIIYFYIASFFLILFDQATKLYFKGFSLLGITHQGYDYGDPVPVIGNFVFWTYIENPGMAFGIEFGWGKIFLSLFSIIAGGLLAMLIYKLRKFNFWVISGFTLIFSGAVGNLIDRVFYGVFFGTAPLFYGKVVDFIQVDIPDIEFLGWTHFPVFNVADSCVTIGVSILILAHNKLPEWHDIFPPKNKPETVEIISEDITTDKSID